MPMTVILAPAGDAAMVLPTSANFNRKRQESHYETQEAKRAVIEGVLCRWRRIVGAFDRRRRGVRHLVRQKVRVTPIGLFRLGFISPARIHASCMIRDHPWNLFEIQGN